MRALVTHNRWGYGGAEVVFYYTIKALSDAGFKVIVAVADKPNLRSYEDVVGEPFPEGVEIRILTPFATGMFSIYKGFVSAIAFRMFSYDVSIATHGYIPPGARGPILYYMHFPAVLTADIMWNPWYSKYSLRHISLSGFREFVKSVPWWLYARPHEFLTKRFYKSTLEYADRILVNSTFTLKALKYTLLKFKVDGVLRKTRILYPPLPRIYEYVNARRNDKLCCAVTVGRFSPEKRYELIVETAKLTPEVKYYIVGGVYGKFSRNYYEKIKKSAPPNVKIAGNVPHSLKVELLSKCAIYIHTMVGEHFGIAPLEAMAVGATPIVPMFSGTWTDVCLEGEYCYGYVGKDPKMLAEKVLEALEKPKTSPLEHVEKFSPKKFEEGIIAEVNSLVES